ncbi:MAG: hypothetical protein RL091_778 [Verrucomicrobiota bacterium]
MIGRIYALSQAQLLKWLRCRVWIQEQLRPTEWQAMLGWAAVAGIFGALAAIVFTSLSEGVHELLTGSRAGVVESMRLLPAWGVILVPGLGGLLAGLVLLLGGRLAPGRSSTDYMEAILIGSGKISIRASLLKSSAALFSIGSGGSIGREGPMVQLAAVAASFLGRWRQFTAPQQRLLVACGASAGIASAYNAPIAGSFFVAEIILSSIAMESLGPLVVSAVAATLTIRALTNAAHLYQVPAFHFGSPWEMGPYLLLSVLVGTVAPWFLRSLRRSERIFVGLKLPLALRLALGGFIVGGLAVFVPEVCGNGYTVVVGILNGQFVWLGLLLIFACKWLATASSFGSGAPGGVFTPSLFMGASTGFLYGTALSNLWPSGLIDPRACALVGMGAFLAAVSHAPVMAIIMLFEMTLSYDIVLPLMLCSVVAYYTARSLEGMSLYSESLKKKAAAAPEGAAWGRNEVAALMKSNPPVIPPQATFTDIARMFLTVRVNNLYVVDADGRFLGAVSLHDIKPYLTDPHIAHLVVAGDLLHEDFRRLGPRQSLSEALDLFIGVEVERLPVVGGAGRLVGSLAKTDMLLALAEQRAAHR